MLRRSHLLHNFAATPLRRHTILFNCFNIRSFSVTIGYEDIDDDKKLHGILEDFTDDVDEEAADDWTLDTRDGVEEHMKKKVRVRRSQHSSRRFVDRIRVKATGGHGGNGCASFFSESAMHKRPNGGHSGAGGDVVVEATDKMQDLSSSMHHFKGGAGTNGFRGKPGLGNRILAGNTTNFGRLRKRCLKAKPRVNPAPPSITSWSSRLSLMSVL
uniref:Obg domain-containing protein n=1 Tax=Hyaloperonospora arabidopsidis (strain Emoy2) TaxID=559515 RepID=M4BIC2_HYAAE